MSRLPITDVPQTKPQTELAYMALGSNLGDSLSILRAAAKELEQLGVIQGRSSLYQTKPFGVSDTQGDFLNAVIAVKPSRPFQDAFFIMKALLELELKHGRQRRQRWDARTLDLDLLAFGKHIIITKDLVLPHPRMMKRAFVLAPLCELNPNWQHPISQECACDRLKTLGDQAVVKTHLSWARAT